jgi:superfamily II DNA/RNA helicase
MLTDPTIEPALAYILDAVNARQEDKRQTFLFSATMVADYSRLFSKEQIFGKFLPPDFNIQEITTNPSAGPERAEEGD